jgi:hypothetical protein
MADHHNENGLNNSPTSSSQAANQISQQEKTSQALPFEPTLSHGLGISDNGLKYGPSVDMRGLHQEVEQPSLEGGSVDVPSQGRRAFTKYETFFHLLLWLVMTG